MEPFQVKIAGALLGPEREKLITLPRKNGKSRLVGVLAAWHLLRTPQAQAVVVANAKEQAEIIDKYARAVAMHPSVETEFEPRFRELRGPDGSTLQVKSADAGRALGLTPTLAIVDEFCVAKSDELYVALGSALLPGATMFVVSTAGWGAETPLGRLRARALAQPDVRVKGSLTDARGPNIRALEWMLPAGELVFLSRTGKRLSQPTLSGYWGKVNAAAGLDFDFYLASKHYGVHLLYSSGCRAAGSEPRWAGQRRRSSRYCRCTATST